MRLVLARLGWTAAILLLVASGSFFLVRLVPGGPFDQEKVTDPVIRANLLAAYDMDAPLGVQYLHYLRGLAHGDFGPSLRYRDYSVNQILAESLIISVLASGAGLVSRIRRRTRTPSLCLPGDIGAPDLTITCSPPMFMSCTRKPDCR